jgi:hypothetical protein
MVEVNGIEMQPEGGRFPRLFSAEFCATPKLTPSNSSVGFMQIGGDKTYPIRQIIARFFPFCIVSLCPVPAVQEF